MRKMPMLFIGHGSPMNAIENNTYTESWREISTSLPKPRAILMLSAHWITSGETRISTQEHPDMIYDMGGFPPELYQIQYNAPGSREIAKEIQALFERDGKVSIQEDPSRGLDHGAWSVLVHLFPLADIPVISMSIDYSLSPRSLYELGKRFSSLRDQGILIVASGNIVHNLRAMDWSGKMTHPWAIDFDDRIASGIAGGIGSKAFDGILSFQQWGEISRMAHPTPDHLLPLFILMGAIDSGDSVRFFTPTIALGSLSMRSILWENI